MTKKPRVYMAGGKIPIVHPFDMPYFWLSVAAVSGGIYLLSRYSSISCRIKAELMTNILTIMQAPGNMDSYVRSHLRSGETATDLSAMSDTHGNSWECWKFSDGTKLTFSHDGTRNYGMAASSSDISFSDDGTGKYTAAIVSNSLQLF